MAENNVLNLDCEACGTCLIRHWGGLPMNFRKVELIFSFDVAKSIDCHKCTKQWCVCTLNTNSRNGILSPTRLAGGINSEIIFNVALKNLALIFFLNLYSGCTALPD